MENCGFVNKDQDQETTFGNAHTFIHMKLSWEAWEDVRLMIRQQPEYRPIRDIVQDTLLRTGHMNSQQLAEIVPNIPQADRDTLADLLTYMSTSKTSLQTKSAIASFVSNHSGSPALPDDDDDITCLAEEYTLSSDEEGKQEEVPSEAWK